MFERLDQIENKYDELTHALADQHYNLDRMHKEAKHDDDRSLAVSALIVCIATAWTGAAGPSPA